MLFYPPTVEFLRAFHAIVVVGQRPGWLERPLSLVLCQFLVDNLLETREASLIQLAAIYKNGRCPPDTRLAAVLEVTLHHGCQGRVLHVLLELFHVKAQVISNFIKFRVIELVEIFEELGVKLPEFALLIGGKRGYSGIHCRFVDPDKGKVLENQLDIVRILLEHLLE